MFSTAQIISKTNAKSFERGSAIAEDADQISERRFLSDRAGCEISSKVRSASAVAERFSTSVFLDADCEEIESFECNCPAARKYSVMCKHCVATALSFKRDPDSFAGYSQRDARVTSRALKRFLDKSSINGTSVATISGVSISTELTNDFGSWSARFKVSHNGHSYVLSDISEFAQAVEDGRFLSYGKRLGFVHSLSAFDPQSKAVAEFISTTAKGKGARRDLQLGDADVVSLLDAIGDSPFDYADVANRANLHGVRVRHGNPRIALDIIEEEGGYRIEAPDALSILRAGGHAYAFDPSGMFRIDDRLLPTAVFIQDVFEESDGDVFIAEEDMPGFCINVLPGLEEGAEVSEPEALAPLKPTRPVFQFYFDLEGKGEGSKVTLESRVMYGEREYDLIALGGSDASGRGGDLASNSDAAFFYGATEDGAYRDQIAEAEVTSIVAELMPHGLALPLADDQEVGTLLFEGLSRLQEVGEVFTTPAFDRLLHDSPISVDIGISLAGNLIDMDIKPSDVSKDELARILSAYRQRKRYHRLSDGKIASMESLDVERFERMVQELGLTLEDIRKGNAQIPAFNAFLLDREYSNVARDKSFEDYIERFDDDALYDFALPEELDDVMRPYQKEGYAWLRKLASIGFGGILADEMGLGKSIQAISYILAMAQEGELGSPALIVCPASLVYNWVEEFAKFAPGITVDPIDGPRSDRRRKLASSDSQVIVASYDTVRIDLERFEEILFSNIFLDETQYIKNHGTKTTRAIKRLRSDRRFALTGTPIENKLSELWSIFDFLMPGFLGSYAQFRTRYESDIVGGDEEAAAHLSALVGPFVLRRLKEDVLDDLPEKQEIVYYVNLPSEQRRLYDATEQSLREDLAAQRRVRRAKGMLGKPAQGGSQVDVLAELLRLRQMALDPSLVYSDYADVSAKTASVIDIVDQAMASGRKSLVFSQFTSYLDILKRELDELGIPYYEITGATDKKERMRLVNSFNGDDTPVFLVSLKAGGTGLNLTGASVVIHTDPWWNIAAINQATDRAHRIGQRNMVNVYRLIAKDTIEERILRLQEAKSELADSVIGDNSLASLKSLTRADLEALLLE